MEGWKERLWIPWNDVLLVENFLQLEEKYAFLEVHNALELVAVAERHFSTYQCGRGCCRCLGVAVF